MNKIILIMFVVIGGMAALIYYGEKKSTERLVADFDKMYEDIYHRPMDMLATTSRGEFEDTLGLTQLMYNYNTDNYKEALGDFNQFLKEHPEFFQVKFYRGITYLQLNKPDQAIEDFKEVMLMNLEFSSEAEWYLALAYLKKKDIDQTKAVLESIISKNNSQSEKSKAALDRMEG